MQHSPLSYLSVFTACIAIIIDQLSKYWVMKSGIAYIYNDGIAFSLPVTNTIALIVSVILILLLSMYGQKLYQGIHTTLFLCSLGLVIGGALSNVIDRFQGPGVIDFIKLPYWPTFNIADMAVCSGIGLMMILLYQEQKNASGHDPNKGE